MFKMEDCKYCKTNEELLIKDFDNWKIRINPNQYYLGRCSIILKRHLEDFTEINKEESQKKTYGESNLLNRGRV